jgi:hypothetical protein
MLVTGCYIEIGDWEFTGCVEMEIVQDVETFTDTCRITLPRKYGWDLRKVALGDDNIGSEPIIKRKDPVLVKFGYDGSLNVEFIGYVRDVKSGTPVTIECEDGMMLLKQESIKDSLTNVTLRQLLQRVIPAGIKYECLDVTVGDWRIDNVTPMRVLEELKSRFGFYSQFRLVGGDTNQDNTNQEGNNVKSVLHVGWPYWIEGRKEEEFAFGQNWKDGKGLIINGDDLVYKRAEDIRIKVKAISVAADNSRHEYEMGDADGELRTLHYYKADTATVKARVEKDLENLKYTGYRGSFSTFGEPSICKGDVVNITGNVYHPDGKYLVRKVTKRFSVGEGIKQVVEPHMKVSPPTP